MSLPTYGYQCTQCSHEFSVFQNMKDEPVRICPECTGDVKRLLYPVGIVFKGSGWYINDSRKPDTSDAPEKSADSSDKSEKSDKADKSDSSEKSETSAKSEKSESATTKGGTASESSAKKETAAT